MPLTHTQSKYHQPHRSGGHTIEHWDAANTTRGSMTTAASQSYGRTEGGNRRSWGGGQQIKYKRTERRQEEEREMHARENWL